MPKSKTTAHNFKLKIMDSSPGINQRFAERVAKRIKRHLDYQAERDARLASLTADEMYDTGLRILGIISDPTPREAIRNVERSAA